MCFLSFVCFTFLRSKQGLKVSELAQGLADDGEACQAMLRVAARVGAWCEWIRPQGLAVEIQRDR
jgi:hypothetical protein